jgi:hypothetical protein
MQGGLEVSGHRGPCNNLGAVFLMPPAAPPPVLQLLHCRPAAQAFLSLAAGVFEP